MPLMQHALAARRPAIGWLVNLGLLVALALLVAGLLAPLMTLTQFWFFDSTVSLLGALATLWHAQEHFLAVVIGAFSVVIPTLKLLLLGLIWNAPFINTPRPLHWLAQHGKWSMLDVFVIAVLVTGIKLKAMTDVTLHHGLYLFAASILLGLALTAWVSHCARAADAAPA